MKKLFNFIPVVMGAIALVGCSNDDFQHFADSKVDLSGKYALKVTVEDSNDGLNMRSYWGNEKEATNLTWVNGEILRVYDSKLQKYDNLVAKNGIFSIDAKDSKVVGEDGTLDYAYALHAEPNCISYAGWNGSNIALLKIEKESINYGEAKSGKNDDVVVYKHAIPMWGKLTPATGDDAEIVGAEQGFSTILRWLTPRAEIKFENGVQANVTAVRARSMKVADGATKEEKEALANLAKTTSVIYTSNTPAKETSTYTALEKLESNEKDAPLSGWFEAILEETEGTHEPSMQKISDETGSVTPDYSNEVVVKVNLDPKTCAYTNVVYLPITYLKNAKYEYLVIEYQVADKWYFLRLVDYGSMVKNEKWGRTERIGGMTVTTSMSKEVSTLADIQEAINAAAEVGSDAEVVLTLKNSIDVEYNQDKTKYQLELPANLTKTVTLTFTESEYKIIPKDTKETERDILTITNPNGATGTLVINNLIVECGIDANFGNAKVQLNGGTYGIAKEDDENGTVKISASELALGTVEFVNTLTLGATDVIVNGEVTLLEGEALKTTGDVTVTETGVIEATIEAANVTVAAKGTAADIKATGNVTVAGTANDITAEGNVTANGTVNEVKKAVNVTLTEGAEVTKSVTASGNVSITKANVGENVTATTGTVTITESTVGETVTTTTGNITVKDSKIKDITTQTGTIEINNLEDDDKLDKEIETINLNGNATVNLKNGFVKNIVNETTAKTPVPTTVTISSEGKSAIGDVKNPDKATISSTWNAGKGYKGFGVNGNYWGYIANDNSASKIYTATQLNYMLGNRNCTLYADIDLDNKAWDGMVKRTRSFNGNGHTISGVVLSSDAKGFINEAGTDGTNSIDIKNLNIDGLSAEGTLSEVGALVGTATTTGETTITISGVNIKDATIKGDDESHDLGGLVGKVDGNVNITKDVFVKAIVEGYYNLGVIVGSMKGNVEIAKEGKVQILKDSKLLVVREYEADDVYDVHAGQAGYVAGQIMENSTLALHVNTNEFFNNVSASTVNPVADLRYDLCRITVDHKDYYFNGCLAATANSFQYFVGFSPESGIEYKKVTTSDLGQTNGYKGETTIPDLTTTKNAFNVFRTSKPAK